MDLLIVFFTYKSLRISILRKKTAERTTTWAIIKGIHELCRRNHLTPVLLYLNLIVQILK